MDGHLVGKTAEQRLPTTRVLLGLLRSWRAAGSLECLIPTFVAVGNAFTVAYEEVIAMVGVTVLSVLLMSSATITRVWEAKLRRRTPPVPVVDASDGGAEPIRTPGE